MRITIISASFTRLSMRPSLLREECEMLDKGELVIIDEVQKIPALLDEVHWLMSVRNLRFILCGSSAWHTSDNRYEVDFLKRLWDDKFV